MIVPAEPMRITSPTLHATIWFTMFVFVTILVMSFLFQVEVVAQGEGRVIPISRVQVVQPEFSGKINAIHVRDGSAVTKGDVLIELDATEAVTDLGTIRAEVDRLHIERARLSAMVQSLDHDHEVQDLERVALGAFAVPPALDGHPFKIEQGRLLKAEIGDVLASLAQISAREEANLRSEDVTKASVSRIDAALTIQSKRLENAEQLLNQGTASQSAFLDVQQVFTDLERERDVYLSELRQKQAERLALDSERRRLIADQRRAVMQRKATIDARLATLDEETTAAKRRVKAATLIAPTSGIVTELTVFTIGGVAEAGAKLMRIVPTNVDIEIEATFSNQDIGFMQIGQPANIGLHAYPSERFGFLKGRVSDIAADSTEVQTGQWGFAVRVEPAGAELLFGEDAFPIRPGMTATIDVTTGKRLIITYFFAPIVETVQDALGER